MKVAHKGLIVVAVPLLFQLAFVYYLGQLINQSRLEFDIEVRARNSIILANRVMINLLDGCVAGFLMNYSGEQKACDAFNRTADRMEKLLPELREQTQEHSLQRQHVDAMAVTLGKAVQLMREASESNRLLGGASVQLQTLADGVGQNLRTFTSTEEELAMKSVASRREIRQKLAYTLTMGVAFDILLAFFLSMLFTSSISRRLLFARENIQNLSKHELPARQLEGDDEIAQLGRAIYRSAVALKDAVQDKADIMMIIKQQLRSPLSVLGSDFDWLVSRGDVVSEQGRLRLTAARKNLQRLLRMVNELLDNSGGLHQKFALTITQSSLSQVLQSAISVTEKFAEENAITIRLSVEDNIIFSGDSDLICQVVVNLITNAIKHSLAGSEVTVSGGTFSGDIMIDVIDKGRGIPLEWHEKIFEPFHQVDKADATIRKGTGLGLAICKAIVEQHGGHIVVESEVGKGSVFRVTLPRNCTRDPGVSSALPRRRIIDSVTAKGLILVLLPLFVTCPLVWILVEALRQVDHDVDRELRAKQAVAIVNEIIIQNVRAGSSRVHFAKEETRFLSARDHKIEELQTLLSDEPACEVLLSAIHRTLNDFDLLTRQVVGTRQLVPSLMSKDGITLADQFAQFKGLLKKLIVVISRTESRKAESRAASFRSLDRILPAALLLSGLLTVGSSLYFTRQIANRLSRLQQGVEQLQSGEISIRPTDENDEIADLQNYFYETASRLLELEQFRGYVVGVVSHEMKTPLQTIAGVVFLLEQGALGELPADCAEVVAVSGPRVKRIIRLVHDLLDIEKINSGTFSLNATSNSLKDICDDGVALVSDLANKNGSRIEMSIMDRIVYLDCDRIASILGTLLENLICFPGTSNIDLCARVESGEVRFAVLCTTSSHDLSLESDLIFERFFAEGYARKQDSLFLHISRDILKQHGGYCTVQLLEGPSHDGPSTNNDVLASSRQIQYTIAIPAADGAAGYT